MADLTRVRLTHLIMARRSAAMFPSPATAQGECAAGRADLALLASAVGQLAPRHREAVILRFWLDLSMQDIANPMGTRVGTAKSHLSRELFDVEGNPGRLERVK